MIDFDMLICMRDHSTLTVRRSFLDATSIDCVRLPTFIYRHDICIARIFIHALRNHSCSVIPRFISPIANIKIGDSGSSWLGQRIVSFCKPTQAIPCQPGKLKPGLGMIAGARGSPPSIGGPYPESTNPAPAGSSHILRRDFKGEGGAD